MEAQHWRIPGGWPDGPDYSWKRNPAATVSNFRNKKRGGGLFRRIVQRSGQECRRCGCKKARKLTLDHIVPISRGGTNYLSNLQILCRPCNVLKDDATIRY